MSVLDNQTKINAGTSFYALSGTGGGGGGGAGSFSTINVSTIDIQANGDINWNGSLNFQQVSGGGASLVSTVSALDGTTPATELLLLAPNNTSEFQIGIANDNKAFISTSGTSLTWNGGVVTGLASLAASNIQISSLNGGAIPVPPQLTVAVTPFNTLAYAPPGGGNSGALLNIPATAQHSYRIEFPVKIQGWNATDGLSNTYAPAIGDSLFISPLGNIVGSPAPVFASFQMAQVSSLNNDIETYVSGVCKCTANGNFAVFANSIGATYSTSVEIGSFCYVTDLGAV